MKIPTSSHFLNLPVELKDLIMRRLCIRSLLNLGSTSKQIHKQIKDSEHLMLRIEMEQADLVQTMPVSSSTAGRKLIKQYQTARLNIPIESRSQVFLEAPAQTLKYRLFRELLGCLSGPGDSDSLPVTLHVWDIRNQDPTRPPRKFLTFSKPKLFDFVVDPQNDLLALLFYWRGDGWAKIHFLSLSSNGTIPHPCAKSEIISHTLSPGPDTEIRPFHRRQFLWVSGSLAAIVYATSTPGRRGVIWDWKTGDIIYDSTNFDSISNFESLVLFLDKTFLVAASPVYDADGTAIGSNEDWIELWLVNGSDDSSPATAQIIARFDLPQKLIATSYQFCGGQPSRWKMQPETHEEEFPFSCNTMNALQVLEIHSVEGRAFLVITNELFVTTLRLHRRNRQARRYKWASWARWTSLWDKELGEISHPSSVCGSRICTVDNYDDGCYELFVVDFNMHIPCSERDCVDPLIHFSAQTFRPNSISYPLPWQNIVGMPFHTRSKRVTTINVQWNIEAVLMDEERMVSAVVSRLTSEPTIGWHIVHMMSVGENTSIVGSDLVPWLGNEEEDFANIRHYETCRMCEREPHTDSHILFECNAHPEVVDIRRIVFEGRPEIFRWRSQFEDSKRLLDEMRACPRGNLRASLLPLVFGIKELYDRLPEGDREVVTPDKEKPASVLFVKRSVPADWPDFDHEPVS